jgi:hypothetical protein
MPSAPCNRRLGWFTASGDQFGQLTGGAVESLHPVDGIDGADLGKAIGKIRCGRVVGHGDEAETGLELPGDDDLVEREVQTT